MATSGFRVSFGQTPAFPIRRNSPPVAAALLRSFDSDNHTTSSERARLLACDRPRDRGPRPRPRAARYALAVDCVAGISGGSALGPSG